MSARVLIGTPSYSGTFPECYVASLLRTFAMERAFDVDWYPLSGSTLLGFSRSKIAARFMVSGCSHLLQIDGDTGWRPEDVERLLAHDVPIVAGAAACRHEDKLRLCPAVDERGHVPCRNGLMQMRAVGMAFVMVKREVFERMVEVYPERKINIPDAPGDAPPVFDFYPVGRDLAAGDVYQSEDHNFCNLARAAGFEVWLDPDIQLQHWGSKLFAADARELFGEVPEA